MTDAKRKINKLTHHQFYSLCEWAKKQNIPESTVLTTYSAVASAAAASLGFPINADTAQSALSAVGIVLVKPQMLEKDDATRYVAAQLIALMTELGREVPKRLREIAS